MCPFVETICVEDGEPQALGYHQQRMNRTRQTFYPDAQALDLSVYVRSTLPTICPGRWKCRVVYDEAFQEVTYVPYQLRAVVSLRLVENDEIDYRYKSTDRSGLVQAFACRGAADDVLIVKNGLLTDTSIGNVALWREGSWYTPASPLLAGTKRQRLIEEGLLQEADIFATDLEHYSRISVFNALIDFGELVVDVKNVLK